MNIKLDRGRKLTGMPREKKRHALLGKVARRTLELLVWRTVTQLPSTDKYVIIGAPHTSLWDYPLTFLYLYSINVRARWLANGKTHPLLPKRVVRALGGFDLPQRTAHNRVDALVEQFTHHDDLVMGFVPEGTTAFVPRWNTGFYHVAIGAGVPIVLGFMDYPSRTIGLAHAFMPSGNLDTDLAALRNYYLGKQGRHPERTGPIKL